MMLAFVLTDGSSLFFFPSIFGICFQRGALVMGRIKGGHHAFQQVDAVVVGERMDMKKGVGHRGWALGCFFTVVW